MWICPACRLPLAFANGTWRCESKHSYDQAKEGYVNLQLAQERNSKAPGDNKEMILARREFLQGGFYDPLISRLTQLVIEHCTVEAVTVENSAVQDGQVLAHSAEHITLFDAGCGEGYYLNQIRSQLENVGIGCSAAGCDISKVAVQRAAKTHKDCDFSVASTFKIPVQTESVDVVIQVFAPSSEAEIARILKPGGRWILVNPAPAHLQQLKEAIYDASKPHVLGNIDAAEFVSMAREQLGFELSFNCAQERLALLKMTPYFWHTSEQGKSHFLDSTDKCQAEFDIQVLGKANAD